MTGRPLSLRTKFGFGVGSIAGRRALHRLQHLELPVLQLGARPLIGRARHAEIQRTLAERRKEPPDREPPASPLDESEARVPAPEQEIEPAAG